MLDQIDAAISLWERYKKWRGARNAPKTEGIATRFIHLFEAHGVHRNQIPRFFGHGLALQDVQDENSILSKFREPLLNDACTLFGVRREWIDGADNQVYPCHDFYKHPEEVAGFLGDLKTNNPGGNLQGVLLAPQKEVGQALLILFEVIGVIGDKPIYRYHLCNNWLFEYWKSRAYLAACVAVASKHKVVVRGVYLPAEKIDPLDSGEVLVAGGDTGAWMFGGRKWYPEEMALKVETFLDGVDPERQNFGITSGLKLWLRLEELGYLDTDEAGHEAVRQNFERELAKHLSG